MWTRAAESSVNPSWETLDQDAHADCAVAFFRLKARWNEFYRRHYDTRALIGDHLTAVRHERGGYLEIEGSARALLIRFPYSEPLLSRPSV